MKPFFGCSLFETPTCFNSTAPPLLFLSAGSPAHLLPPPRAGLGPGGAPGAAAPSGGGVRHAGRHRLSGHGALAVRGRPARRQEVDQLQGPLLLPGTHTHTHTHTHTYTYTHTQLSTVTQYTNTF